MPDSRPECGLAFLRGVALGNDYLVWPAGGAWRASAGAIRAVCHRRTGIGGDGIIWYEQSPARHRARIFNPDGSEAERSGNGLRILAAALLGRDEVGADPFEVEVGGDVVEIRVSEADAGVGVDAEVAMGRVRHGPDAVGLDRGALDGSGRIRIEGLGAFRAHPVSVGNPHLVLFAGGDPSAPDLPPIDALGPALSDHAALARGANVQRVRVTGAGRLEAEVWERGAGATPSSGSSACAVAAAGVASGRVDPGTVRVAMPGGTLEVRVREDGDVTLRGPARILCTGELSPGFVRSLRA